MIFDRTEAITNNLFFLLMIPAALFVGCSLDGDMSGGPDEVIEDKIVNVSSACDYSNEGNDGGTYENAFKSLNAESFLGVNSMAPMELEAEEFWNANDVSKLIEKYDSIEIVSSSYEDGAAQPLYTNNYWYSREYSANKNEPGDAFIVKDNVRAVSRPAYMNSDNKEETGIMIELYSSPDSRMANVAENIYVKNDEIPVKRCLHGNGEVYFELERDVDYPNEDALDNKESHEKTTRWGMVFDEETKVLKRAAITSTNVLGGIIDTRYYEVKLGTDMPGMYTSLKNVLDENLAASDEDSRNIHFVYGAGNANKKAGDFKVKKGTKVIFETSEGNLFLDEKGTIPYDPSDLTSDITVYRIKK